MSDFKGVEWRVNDVVLTQGPGGVLTAVQCLEPEAEGHWLRCGSSSTVPTAFIEDKIIAILYRHNDEALDPDAVFAKVQRLSQNTLNRDIQFLCQVVRQNQIAKNDMVSVMVKLENLINRRNREANSLASRVDELTAELSQYRPKCEGRPACPNDPQKEAVAVNDSIGYKWLCTDCQDNLETARLTWVPDQWI